MNEAYLLTGGNLGNRMAHLRNAKELIEQKCGASVQHSSVYQTAAWGYENQPDFLNQALLLYTTFPAKDLMQTLLCIEEQMGRKRVQKMGPRIIDIDILLFNDEIIHAPALTVPHPHLHERRFALLPLAEIAPDKMHPLMNKTIQQLLNECTDKLPVYKIISDD